MVNSIAKADLHIYIYIYIDRQTLSTHKNVLDWMGELCRNANVNLEPVMVLMNILVYVLVMQHAMSPVEKRVVYCDEDHNISQDCQYVGCGS